MKIITSLAPGDLPTQQAAVASWRKAAFEVVSVNSASEIAKLKPSFPNVLFDPSPDAPPRIRDLFKTVKPNELVGIVNSDILLMITAQELFGLDDVLLFGARTDVNDFSRLEGQTFISGFDYFFFYGRHAPKLNDPVFRIGRPAWDYYLPCTLMQSIKGVRMVTPVAYHKKHAKRWNQAQHTDFCRHLLKVLKVSSTNTVWRKLQSVFPIVREELHMVRVRVRGGK